MNRSEHGSPKDLSFIHPFLIYKVIFRLAASSHLFMAEVCEVSIPPHKPSTRTPTEEKPSVKTKLGHRKSANPHEYHVGSRDLVFDSNFFFNMFANKR